MREINDFKPRGNKVVLKGTIDKPSEIVLLDKDQSVRINKLEVIAFGKDVQEMEIGDEVYINPEIKNAVMPLPVNNEDKTVIYGIIDAAMIEGVFRK